MPGQKRKGEFWFLENLHVPRGKAILLFTKLNYWFEPYLRKESYTVTAHYENKQLMPGQKRNGEFCFLETLHDPRGKAKGNIEIEGNKTHCFLQGQSLSVLLYLPTHKYKKNWRNHLLDASWLTNLLQFQNEEHDLIICKSKVQVIVSLGS